MSILFFLEKSENTFLFLGDTQALLGLAADRGFLSNHFTCPSAPAYLLRLAEMLGQNVTKWRDADGLRLNNLESFVDYRVSKVLWNALALDNHMQMAELSELTSIRFRRGLNDVGFSGGGVESYKMSTRRIEALMRMTEEIKGRRRDPEVSQKMKLMEGDVNEVDWRWEAQPEDAVVVKKVDPMEEEWLATDEEEEQEEKGKAEDEESDVKLEDREEQKVVEGQQRRVKPERKCKVKPGEQKEPGITD